MNEIVIETQNKNQQIHIEFNNNFQWLTFQNFINFMAYNLTFSYSRNRFMNSKILNISYSSFEEYVSLHKPLALYSHDGNSLLCVSDFFDYHYPVEMWLVQTYWLVQRFIFRSLKGGLRVTNPFNRGGGGWEDWVLKEGLHPQWSQHLIVNNGHSWVS